jgi:hypothetical protein
MRFVFVIVFSICVTACVSAQTLEGGDNEFGVWAGFSPKATTIFEGLRDDEAGARLVSA